MGLGRVLESWVQAFSFRWLALESGSPLVAVAPEVSELLTLALAS